MTTYWPGAQLDQVAARRQAGQRGLQFVALVALGAEFADELLEIGAGVRQPRDVRQQCGVSQHDSIMAHAPKPPFSRVIYRTIMPRVIPA